MKERVKAKMTNVSTQNMDRISQGSSDQKGEVEPGLGTWSRAGGGSVPFCRAGASWIS